MVKDTDGDFLLDEKVARGVEWRPTRRVFATYFSEHEVKSNWARVVDIKGGEAAVIFRNGKVQEFVTQKRLRAGGLFNRIKSAIGMPSSLSFLLLDTTRLELEILFGQHDKILGGPAEEDWYSLRRGALVTRDKGRLSARVTAWVRLRFDELLQLPSRVDHLLGLMKGQRHLTHEQIADLLLDSGLHQTLQEVTYKTDAATFRANSLLDDEIVTQCRSTVQERLQYLGFWLEELKIVWGVTSDEFADIHEQEMRAQERRLDVDNEHKLADLRRSGRQEFVRTEQAHRASQAREDFRRAQQAADAETEVAARELKESQRLRAKAQEDLIEVQRLAAENELGMKSLEHVKRLRMESEELQRRHQDKLLEANNQLTASLLNAAAATQNLTPDTIKNIMQIATLGNAAALGADQAAAVAQAVGGQRQLDAHRAGMSDALAQQSGMLQGTAQLAHGLNPAGLIGFGVPQRATPVLPGAAKGGLLAAAQPTCPACAQPVETTWSRCPGCGANLQTETASACSRCHGETQPGWEVCPACGNALQSTASCGSCGQEMKASWKLCPVCGSPNTPPVLARCAACQRELEPDWKRCPDCGEAVKAEPD